MTVATWIDNRMGNPASDTPGPVSETADGIQIEILVQPRASRTGLVGLHGGRLKIAVTQAPESGKANLAILAFLAKCLRVPKSNCSLLRGHTSRMKTVLAAGISPREAHVRLGLEPNDSHH